MKQSSPTTITDLKNNCKNNYVNQFRIIDTRNPDSKYKKFKTLCRIKFDSRYSPIDIRTVQFRFGSDSNYKLVFIDAYGTKKEIDYAPLEHDSLLNAFLNNDFLGYRNEIDNSINDKSFFKYENKVFKNKNFNPEKVYADNIKISLIKYLRLQYPSSDDVIVPEFTVGKSIADLVVLTKDSFHTFEIKSMQDSFSRLDKQLRDFGNISHSTTVVLDTKKVKKFKSDYKNKYKRVGITEVDSNNEIKHNKKPYINKKIDLELITLIWSVERLALSKGFKLHSKIDSYNFLPYLDFVFNHDKHLNNLFMINVLRKRNKSFSDKIFNNPDSINDKKVFVKDYDTYTLLDFQTDFSIEIKSPFEYFEHVSNTMIKIHSKYKFLENWKKLKESNDNLSEYRLFLYYCTDKFKDSLMLNKFRVENDYLLVWLYDKKLLNKCVSEYKVKLKAKGM